MTARTARCAAIAVAIALLAVGTAAAVRLMSGRPTAPSAHAAASASAPKAAAAAAAPGVSGTAAAPGVSAAAAASGVSGAHAGHRPPGFSALVPAAAPAGWRRLILPDGKAVLYYPPGMRRVSGDTDAVSSARLGPDGRFLLYLNATPRQGDESLRNWASFRLRHLRSDDAARARRIAAVSGQRFRGGTGSCVIDAYVTRIRSHHFTEIACLVQGRTGASVIVAAAPTPRWPTAEPILDRAVSAYLVH